jgi:hypothetical protein
VKDKRKQGIVKNVYLCKKKKMGDVLICFCGLSDRACINGTDEAKPAIMEIEIGKFV